MTKVFLLLFLQHLSYLEGKKFSFSKPSFGFSKPKPKPAAVPSYPKQSYGQNYGGSSSSNKNSFIPPAGTSGNKIPPAGTSNGYIPPAGTNYGSNSNNFGSSNSFGSSSNSWNKPSVSKSSNYNNFMGTSSSTKPNFGGATFSKTFPKSSYLNTLKSDKSKLVKGALALGTAYVGYKIAKSAGKALSKAYIMGMTRPTSYYNRNWYVNNDDYIYRGQLNEYCDIWYDLEENEEIMRCDQGYYYNYNYENVNSPNYRPGYSNFSNMPTDWADNQKYRDFDNQFDNDYKHWRYETRNDPNDIDDIAAGIGGGIIALILIISCCSCFCFCVGIYYVSNWAQGAFTPKGPQQTNNFEMDRSEPNPVFPGQVNPGPGYPMPPNNAGPGYPVQPLPM